MDNSILRKKLNTFKSSAGVLKNVSNEVIIEVLRAWENWPGTTADLYRELDVSKGQMSALIRNGKKLVKSGMVTEDEFHEIKMEPQGSVETGNTGNCCLGIEINWSKGQVIRFSQVDQLIDFLKKAA